ncbi:hypothetical protein CKG00_14545 (plasmid) [Morganella morganii]|uniref:Uncharacterized protein n=1 Tax=Morganella morganii TaxID=582 RepID=A0A433ZQM2_MORMO|nr:hypothetical protein CKG00_14545 [Morganella morganii]
MLTDYEYKMCNNISQMSLTNYVRDLSLCN